MSIETSAREEFGLLIKRFRAEKKWNRGIFASLVGTSFNVIKRMEHGVKNPSRQELVRAINILGLSGKELNEAYRLLRIFSPRRRRTKFHRKSYFLRNKR